MQSHYFGAHREEQFGVELDKGSSNRKTWGLLTVARPTAILWRWSTRHVARVAFQQRSKPQDAGGIFNRGFDLGGLRHFRFQRESHVLESPEFSPIR